MIIMVTDDEAWSWAELKGPTPIACAARRLQRSLPPKVSVASNVGRMCKQQTRPRKCFRLLWRHELSRQATKPLKRLSPVLKKEAGEAKVFL